MRKYISAIVLGAVLHTAQVAYAQPCLSGACNLNVTASHYTICPGESSTLTAVGNSALLQNDFNTQTVGSGWILNNINVMFNNPCGAFGIDGTPYIWFGNTSGAADRVLTSVDFDVTTGGQITFDLRFSIQGQASPCEGPDLSTEGVYFQYSTNFGASWTTIFYFDPNINNSGGTVSSPYVTWNTYSYPIPVAAQTPCTRFRWRQQVVSGAGNDHWGLDNIFIGSTPNPATTSFIWLDNGAQANVPRVVTPTVTTSYVAMYATTLDTCYDTVTVVVQNFTPFTVDAGPDRTICPNSVQTFAGTISGGVPPYTVAWFYPNGAGTNPLTFSPTQANAGNFVLTASHACAPNVQVTDTLVLTIGPPQFQIGLDLDSISCFGTNDGAIDVTVTGQTPPFTYLWTPGNINTPDLSNLAPATYTLTVTDAFGCTRDTSIVMTQPTNISFGLQDRFICSGDSVVILPNPLPNTSYTWSPASHIFNPNDPSPMFYGVNNGPTYDTIQVTVNAVSTNSCGRDTFIVYLAPAPQVALGVSGLDTLVICNNDTIFLTNTLSNAGYPPVTSQLWQDNSTATVYPTITPGLYWLELRNSANCTARDSVQLIVAQPPVASIDPEFFICGNETIYIFGTGYAPGDQTTWSSGETTDTIAVNTSGTYTLIVSNSCASDTVSTNVIQIPAVNASTLPNIITPNGDAVNDMYFLENTFDYTTNFNVKIMNRWGAMVFQSNDPQIKWSPKNISDGVYFIAIVYNDCNNELKYLAQSVTVISK